MAPRNFPHAINQKGHTLIEMLLVLSILSVALSLPFLYFSTIQSSVKSKEFIEQLENDLLRVQQTALVTDKTVLLRIYPHRNEYQIRTYSEVLEVRSIPEDVQFTFHTINADEIRYLANGNIFKPGTIFLRAGDKQYRIVFLLGRGRFYIQEY
ncbi:competence type IV pilus minor pilin ComGD [Thalassorhabdus alkalitolerans]|uniref:Competence type IV pilus minor pilin ComGD n=1 Tax=Thalassorhabdus alkalitolerans TaxID=2282697 RepID=A0ABW0YSK8_9BACI